MPKVDVWLSNSVMDAATRAAELEGTGVDGVFTFENAHDVFFPLVAAAPVCSLDLMTNVAIAFPRSPMHLANAAYDLQMLSGGRFRLGLGSQIRTHIERRYGATWGKPVEHMREVVLATKAILGGWQNAEKIEFRGEYTTHTLMTPVFDPGPNPHGIAKVLVGALGPRMNRMAAEVADGVLVMPFNTERHMRERTMPAIESGLVAGARDRVDIEVVAEVIVAMGRDEQELAAADAARFIVAFYGSTPAYRPVLEVEGQEELQPELNTLSKQGKWLEMVSLVDDDLFRRIAVYGSPEECAAAIAASISGLRPDQCLFPGLFAFGRAHRGVRLRRQGDAVTPPVLFHLEAGVAQLTLNDPPKRNAFSRDMARLLAEHLSRCDQDEGVRVVVITGTPPAFCSGADLSDGGGTFRPRDQDSFSASATAFPAWRVRKPVIAAVNGHAIGLGLTLTLQCDIRIFAADARYGIVQVRRGVMGDAYAHWTLPRIVGMSAAADILLTGRTFDGREAKDLGLCSQVLPNVDVLPVALDLARDMATNTAPLSVALSKQLLWDTWGKTPEDIERLETEFHHRLMASPDAREGVLAFLEKRPPRWSGRIDT